MWFVTWMIFTGIFPFVSCLGIIQLFDCLPVKMSDDDGNVLNFERIIYASFFLTFFPPKIVALVLFNRIKKNCSALRLNDRKYFDDIKFYLFDARKPKFTIDHNQFVYLSSLKRISDPNIVLLLRMRIQNYNSFVFEWCNQVQMYKTLPSMCIARGCFYSSIGERMADITHTADAIWFHIKMNRRSKVHGAKHKEKGNNALRLKNCTHLKDI